MRYGIYENGELINTSNQDWEAIAFAKNEAAWWDAGIIEVFDFETNKENDLIWTNEKEKEKEKENEQEQQNPLLEEAKILLQKVSDFHESIFITGRPLTIDGKTIDHTLLNDIGDGSRRWIKRYKKIERE